MAGVVPALLALAAHAGTTGPTGASDPLASETVLTGRAERDNWGVPTMFGRKGSPTVAQ